MKSDIARLDPTTPLFCKKKGWLISRQVEIMMEEQLKREREK